jgi:predicted TIM-barrel fold metal-dependent hydrolase
LARLSEEIIDPTLPIIDAHHHLWEVTGYRYLLDDLLADLESGHNVEATVFDWRPYIESCIDAFGVNRRMFESNFPVDKAACSYSVLWNAFKRLTWGASAGERAALFHDTAQRFYRL